MTSAREPLQVGQRVYSALYGGRYGMIVKIHGEQRPETVRSILGGVGVTGGSAKFDVVFSNGSQSSQLCEAIVHGSKQWKIFDDVATPEEVADAIRLATKTLADGKQAEADAKAAFRQAVESLQADPAYSHLEKAEPGKRADSSGVQAGRNMKKELAAAFPGVRFSIRKSGYGSLYVSWTDGPITKDVEAITNRYLVGRFDGIQDIFEYDSSPWTEVFGGVKYASCQREPSIDLISKAIDAVWEEFSGNLKDTPKVTAEDYKRGATNIMHIPNLGSRETLDHFIRGHMAKMTVEAPAKAMRKASPGAAM